jgi:hypothetical protein
MYLKRTQAPHSVMLADGTTVSRSELPDAKTRRWVASRKATVVQAVQGGLITNAEACEMYGLSEEELDGWCSAVSKHGERALKTTSMQKYRQISI